MNKVSDPQFWNERYLENNTKWDLGSSTPILVNYLKIKNSIGKVCVLGCGNGHDALEFSKYKNEVYSVDFSTEALKNLKDKSEDKNLKLHLINQDIFALPDLYKNYFDMIYEYTCYCAIDPNRREEYFEMVHTILKKGGLFFGIMIPLDKEMYNEEGPPFGVSINQVLTLISGKFEVVSNNFSEFSIEPRKGREKVVVLKKI